MNNCLLYDVRCKNFKPYNFLFEFQWSPFLTKIFFLYAMFFLKSRIVKNVPVGVVGLITGVLLLVKKVLAFSTWVVDEVEVVLVVDVHVNDNVDPVSDWLRLSWSFSSSASKSLGDLSRPRDFPDNLGGKEAGNDGGYREDEHAAAADAFPASPMRPPPPFWSVDVSSLKPSFSWACL